MSHTEPDDVSKHFIEQLNSLQEDFIWNLRRPKIKHSTPIADYVEGGYKDIDIKTKLSSVKVIWIKNLMDDNFHAWKAIPMAWLSNNGSFQIFNENFKPSQCLLHNCHTYHIFIASSHFFGKM